MADNKREFISPTCFLSLPPELLAREILPHLPLQSLIQCLSTCRQINELISSSVELAYLMELEVAGMKDNPHCPYTTYPVAQRLETLRERERRWSQFDWEWRREVELPPMTSGNYDLAPGLYLQGKLADNGSGMSGLYYGSLPSDRDSAVVWMEIRLGKKLIDFAESIENDLLVCVSLVDISSSSINALIQVDFLAISTGLPHPLARSPTLDICTHSRPPDGLRLCVESYGEHFALTYESDDRVPESRATLYVWEWKTGEKQAEIPIGGRSGLGGLVFLREDFLMHTNAQGNRLDIFYVKPSGDPDTGGSNVQCILSLSMPPLTIGYHVRLKCLHHASPTSSPNIPHVMNSTSRPFFNDPQAEVLVITSNIYGSPGPGFRQSALLTHRKALLELALSAWERGESWIGSGGDGDSRHTPSLDWEEWGPPSTHIFLISPYVPATSHSSAGQRWVRIRHQQRGPYFLELFDFNQLRVRRMCQSWATQTKSVEIQPNPVTNVIVTMDSVGPGTVLSASTHVVYAQDVHSYLPCLRTCYSRTEAPNSTAETILQRSNPWTEDGAEHLEPDSRNRAVIRRVVMEEERIIGLYPRIPGVKAILDVAYFG